MNRSVQKEYRICFVAEEYFPIRGGIAEYSKNLAETLQSHGHEINVVSEKISAVYSDSESSVKIFRIGKCDIRRFKLGPFARYHAVARFKKELSEWIDHNYKSDKLDFCLFSSLSEWAVICHRKKIPYAVCVHGGDAFGKRKDFLRSLYRRWIVYQVLKNASFIFANSVYTAEMIQRLNSSLESKLEVSYCGVSRLFLEAIERAKMDTPQQNDRHRLLMLCRLVPIKACDIVIRSVFMLKDRYPNIFLTIAGDGPQRTELEMLSDKLGISHRIDFAGYVSDIDEKVKLYLNSDIYVQSGRVDPRENRAEAFGIVFAEAGICGKPAIGPNIGGVKEVILHNETGLLISPDNAEACAEAISSILEKREMGIRMGEKAKQWVSEQFSYERIANLIANKFACYRDEKDPKNRFKI